MVLEYALRVAVLQATDSSGARHLGRPGDPGDGYGAAEVASCAKAASATLLAVLAVCLVATDADRVGVGGGGETARAGCGDAAADRGGGARAGGC